MHAHMRIFSSFCRLRGVRVAVAVAVTVAESRETTLFAGCGISVVADISQSKRLKCWEFFVWRTKKATKYFLFKHSDQFFHVRKTEDLSPVFYELLTFSIKIENPMAIFGISTDTNHSLHGISADNNQPKKLKP